MTNIGLINSFNEINNFLIFLRNEYAAAAQEGNLTSGDLTAAVKMNETATAEANESAKDILEREFEKIQEEVGIDKEILGALPKNGSCTYTPKRKKPCSSFSPGCCCGNTTTCFRKICIPSGPDVRPRTRCAASSGARGGKGNTPIRPTSATISIP